MIGILIALQINNWNEIAKSYHLEQQQLEGLKEELITNKAQLEEVIKQHKWARNSCRTLLGLFDQDLNLQEDRNIDSLIDNMISYWTYDPRIGFLNSIISSGKISHIRNKSLVTLLSEFEDHVYDVNESQSWIIDLWKDNLGYEIIQFIPTISTYRIKNGREAYHSSLTVSRFPPNYIGFFNNSMIESLIARMYGYQGNGLEEEVELLSTMEHMILIIDTELNNR